MLRLQCVLMLPASIALGLIQESRAWPTVKPLEIRRQYRADEGTAVDSPLVAIVRDAEGAPVYSVECHTGDYEDTAAGFSYSGDYQCALFAVKGSRHVTNNLLAADTKDERSVDWWNRGRMRAAQLRGACLDYPEYSTDRHFRLRGMLLTMRFTRIRWHPRGDADTDPALQGFIFVLTVVPDSSVAVARAEPGASPRPPRQCYP